MAGGFGCKPVLFPPLISSGAVGGPRFKTTIVTGKTGYEQRNIDWENARGDWTIDRNHLTPAQFNELVKFYYAVARGEAYSWLFKDWADYKMVMVPVDDNPPLILTATSPMPATTQLVKLYTYGGYTYSRDITRPVAGTVVLYANGTTIDAANYSINYSTGVITWGGSPSYNPGAGVLITADCDFYVPCRLNVDWMGRQVNRGPVYEWTNIPILEVRNELDIAP